MKSIKEKQLLVKWSKAMNEPIDDLLAEEVSMYEKIQKDILESVRKNSVNDLTEASKVAEELVNRVNEYPKPPTLDEVLSVLREEVEELVEIEEVFTETKPQPSTSSLAERAAELITKEAKLEEKADSFQQPNPSLVPEDLGAIRNKLKFLEQWLAKVSMAGPGSGEVEFRNLDDVDKASFADRDTHKLLRYKPNANPAFDSVYFDFLSGDQGEIFSLKYNPNTGYTSNANVAPGLTYYDPDRDTLEILHKDGAATYTGLDNYIRVTNNGSGNTIPRGSFVRFAGVDPSNLVPIVEPFAADANAVPLYSVGITATELASNTRGRAILLGEIEDLDTTGNSVGEAWTTGDLLWAHPTVVGGLTKFKPTAPNVTISVAAVLSANATAGRLLVRPTIWPRMRYGDFFSIADQIAPSINQGYNIAFSNTLISSGVIRTGNVFTVADSGLYKFDFRGQIASGSSNQKSIIVWFKKNDINVPFSSVRISTAENGAYDTIVNTQLISLLPTDNVTVNFTVNNTDIFIDSPAIFNGAANIPSVQMTVTEVSL